MEDSFSALFLPIAGCEEVDFFSKPVGNSGISGRGGSAGGFFLVKSDAKGPERSDKSPGTSRFYGGRMFSIFLETRASFSAG